MSRYLKSQKSERGGPLSRKTPMPSSYAESMMPEYYTTLHPTLLNPNPQILVQKINLWLSFKPQNLKTKGKKHVPIHSPYDSHKTQQYKTVISKNYLLSWTWKLVLMNVTTNLMFDTRNF